MYKEYFKMKQEEFILHKGLDKYKTLNLKVIESKMMNRLIVDSSQKRYTPTPNDFYISVSNIFYLFVRLNTDLNIMAALIVLDEWNDRVNKTFGLATDEELYFIANRIVQLITSKERRI